MPAIERVLIVGAGWVGRQIALCLAQTGIAVCLIDRQRQVGEDALAWMRDQEPSPEAAAVSLSRISLGDSLQEVGRRVSQGELPPFDLAIESVPEQISLKKRVLRELSSEMSADTIIASNSSYFTPSQLADFVTTPARFAHLHFHVPVLVRSVVDVVGCAQTQPQVIDRLCEMVASTGHHPLRLRHEHPGYIFNWLLQSVLRSALELAALDVADIEEIDRSWKAVTGMPLGPFGIMDRIGLDVIEQVLSNARWSDRAEVPVDQLLAILRKHTAAGALGVKSQKGFYDYAAEAPSENTK